jgi:NAD(P)-dependent dehydrogenase (short-subunit alcohol dehydrogenase family)
MNATAPAPVLVTGAATGIGRSIAERFAAQGHRVTGTWHTTEPPDDSAVDYRQCDVADEDSVGELFAGLEGDRTPLIIVSNAAVLRISRLARMSDDDLRGPLETNLIGAHRILRFAHDGLARARWGRVVLVGSAVASLGAAAQTNYTAAKAGLVGLARSAARELGRRNVTVNVIEPGLIDTALVRDRPTGWWDDAVASIPAARAGEPGEVADLVDYLCSDAGAAINGALVRIDGAMLARARP